MENPAHKVSKRLKTLPNKLTAARVAAIPFLLILYPWEIPVLRGLSAMIFLAAAATDYFDGYIARKYGGVTRLGAVLDPISDKILVASAIILLTYTQQLPAWISTLILCREIAVSGLRLAATEYQMTIEVSQTGKYKTAVQDAAIVLLMLSLPSLQVPGMILIWVSIALSYFSAYQYWTGFWHRLQAVKKNDE
ncbi:MAG: CDP-diacylglycerol--glycerol-3-phosphate 3-phosphatidyltransferase [Oligoflexus sp.]